MKHKYSMFLAHSASTRVLREKIAHMTISLYSIQNYIRPAGQPQRNATSFRQQKQRFQSTECDPKCRNILSQNHWIISTDIQTCWHKNAKSTVACTTNQSLPYVAAFRTKENSWNETALLKTPFSKLSLSKCRTKQFGAAATFLTSIYEALGCRLSWLKFITIIILLCCQL